MYVCKTRYKAIVRARIKTEWINQRPPPSPPPPYSTWNDEWKYGMYLWYLSSKGVKWGRFLLEMAGYSSILVVRRRKQVFIQLSDPTSSIPISVTIFSRLSALWSMTSSLDNYLWIMWISIYISTRWNFASLTSEDRGGIYLRQISL